MIKTFIEFIRCRLICSRTPPTMTGDDGGSDMYAKACALLEDTTEHGPLEWEVVYWEACLILDSDESGATEVKTGKGARRARKHAAFCKAYTALLGQAGMQKLLCRISTCMCAAVCAKSPCRKVFSVARWRVQDWSLACMKTAWREHNAYERRRERAAASE